MSFTTPLEPSPNACDAGIEAGALAAAAMAACPVHAATPLVRMDRLADELGLGGLVAKDERWRFGLPSFKATGGGYAVLAIAAEARFGRADADSIGRLVREARQGVRLQMTFAAATAGNHGRAVAAAARLAGAAAAIYVHPGVAPALIAAIRAEGARIVERPGTYDDAVAACREAAGPENLTIVSDTAWPGYEATPRRVMEGYGVIARELLAQASPTHLFVQAGVGSLAGGLAAALPRGGPRLVVVEPEAAAPLFASAAAGELTSAPRGPGTIMGRLECYEASLLAWRILRDRAAGFLTVLDAESVAAAERLAELGFPASPTGAAGLAGLVAAALTPAVRAELQLDGDSRAAVIITEPKA